MNIQIRGTVRKRADGTIDTEELIIELKDRSGKRQGWCLAVPYLRQGDYPAVESEGDPYQAGVKAMYDKLVACVEERRQKQEAIIAMGHLQAAGSQISEGDQSERLTSADSKGFLPVSSLPKSLTELWAISTGNSRLPTATRYAMPAVRYPCLLQKKITATE